MPVRAVRAPELVNEGLRHIGWKLAWRVDASSRSPRLFRLGRAVMVACSRAVDVRDPYHPKEIAYYVPAINGRTDKRCADEVKSTDCKIAIQTNNMEVDDRGYIYIVDRANTGLDIVELTGAARAIANYPKTNRVAAGR